MALRYRPMRPEDVRKCVGIVAPHPFLGPQYGRVVKDLWPVWLNLLGREAFRAVVFEDAKDSEVRRVGVGVSVFTTDDFLTDLRTPPLIDLGTRQREKQRLLAHVREHPEELRPAVL